MPKPGQQEQQRQQHRQCTATATADAAENSAEEGGDGGLAAQAAALAAPAQRLQPTLTAKERTQRRSEAERLVSERKMIMVQVGAAGITPAVLSSLMDVLVKRQFVRLKCGAGGAERKALAQQLSRLLDAEVVHQIGFTVTLYRAAGLARPTGCSCSSPAKA